MKRPSIVIGAAALTASLAGMALPSQASDHLDAPAVMEDGRTDLNDLYAFQSPDNPDNSVMIMTVNPGAGAISGTEFDLDAWYDFQVDNDADPFDDSNYVVRFYDKPGGIEVGVYGPNAAGQRTFLGMGPADGSSIDLVDGGRLSAGLFDDPFFFDLDAFNNGLAFCSDGTGTDFFAGLNVSGIVLEVPTSSVGGDGNAGIWTRTLNVSDRSQIDRIGRPAINTVFIGSDDKDAFNQTVPWADQRVWRDDVVAALEGLGNDNATAQGLTDVLLPDVLTVDFNSTAGFLNGRGLADDVIDAELDLISGGALTTDCVDSNDVAFPGTFPFLAPAN